MNDDFSEPVKRVLASRVGNQCSNPECRALTSGPQDDPAKAVNVGVAAHITAASPGGPRYDPDLLPEERSGPGNGIWLCQNDAKLIDNDVARFRADLLRQWKSDAEAEAKHRVGRTGIFKVIEQPRLDLSVDARVRIAPIVPRQHEQSDFRLTQDSGLSFHFEKLDSQRQVEIPKSFIEKVHNFGHPKPGFVQLCGRLQWVTAKRSFELFPDKPPTGPTGAFGIAKDVDFGYPGIREIIGKFFPEDRVPRLLAQGWRVYYDLDGTYLRWRSRDANQIFIHEWA